MVSLVTACPDETVEFGVHLGRLLAPGDFVALTGELGAGKTRFAQGVARGLGVDAATIVTSPTFTILNEYHGTIPFYHFDLYRLRGDDDVLDLGFDEYFHGEGVCLVEWAERLDAELPAERLVISFAHQGDDSRKIVFEPHGERYRKIVQRIAELISCKKSFDP